MLGRLGAIVSPVHGSADLRHSLTEKRAQHLSGSPACLQRVHALRSAAVEHWRDAVESHERELAQLQSRVERAGNSSTELRLLRPSMQQEQRPRSRRRVSTEQLAEGQEDISVSLTQLQEKLLRAKAQLAEAEEARGLTELAIHHALSQGEQRSPDERNGTPNAQNSFLAAMRASSLARNRKLEQRTNFAGQVKRARAGLTLSTDVSGTGLGRSNSEPHSASLAATAPSLSRQKASAVSLRKFVSEASLLPDVTLPLPSEPEVKGPNNAQLDVTSMKFRIKALRDRAASRPQAKRAAGAARGVRPAGQAKQCNLRDV